MKTKKIAMLGVAVVLLILSSCILRSESKERMWIRDTETTNSTNTTIGQPSVKLSPRDKEFKSAMIRLHGYKFQHTFMPKFFKDPLLKENWAEYREYLVDIFPGLTNADIYLGLEEEESLYVTIYVVDPKPMFSLVLDTQEEMSERMDECDRLIYTSVDTLDCGLVPRIVFPRVESFTSKEVSQLLFQHEYTHVNQLLNGEVMTQEKQEIMTYLSESELLKSYNPEIWNAFVTHCAPLYKKYGFCKELQNICISVYQTESLSRIERESLEAGLLVMLAMAADSVEAGNANKMKAILDKFEKYR